MKLDRVDVKILKILEKEGRTSFREIAKKIEATTPTVSSKVSMLEQMGLIKGFRASFDTDVLGEISILLTIKSKPSDVLNIADKLKELEEVRELYILGGSLLHLKVTFIDFMHLNKFILNLSKIESILDYDYKIIIDTVKEEQRALVMDGLNTLLKCFYCKKPMHDKPVKLKLDGKDHFLCCEICAKEYKKKYDRIKEGI